MFYAADGKGNSLLTCLLFFVFSSLVPVYAAVQEVPVVYGAPYNGDSRYSYRVTGASSLPGAVSEWWAGYQSYWGVSTCGYSLTLYPSSSERRAYRRLHSGCGGGGSIYGTAQCPAGYQVVDNRCLIAPDEPKTEKDNGPSCNVEGNPVNAATGNKYQPSIDFQGVGPAPLAIKRHYNSTDKSIGAFGTGWQWEFSTSLSRVTQETFDSIQLQLGNGRILYFVKEDGAWVSDTDVLMDLSESADDAGYLLTHPDGSYLTFNAAGLLLSRADRIGRVTTFDYNTSNRLIRIMSEFGQELTIGYAANNLINQIEHSSGNVWNYEYDDSFRLIQVTDPNGGVKKYLYEDPSYPFALTGIEDALRERYATFNYDSQGRAIKTIHANGADQYRFSYDSLLQTTVANPLGKKTTYHYEVIEGVKRPVRVGGHESASCASASQFYEYDVAGRVVKKVGWNGVVTTFERNPRGLVVNRVEADGLPSQRTVRTEWHPTYDLPVRVSDGNREREFVYDEAGKLRERADLPAL